MATMNTFLMQRTCLTQRLRTLHQCEVVLMRDIVKANTSFLRARARGLHSVTTIIRNGESLHVEYNNLMKQIEAVVYELSVLEFEMMDHDLVHFVVLDDDQTGGKAARSDPEIYRAGPSSA
ncbi:uncharacterized protein H6S33_008596 [Morchella sextelata]|uniref:uncharacterized protein n=1 Tax=Morchella sextelata TaxID=1174677 RepID=UPI001D04C8A6|nr:uncharacterized protein H6S33_008596 [Morchella sextelata]KAH0602515.1 hypothetical protein H6S33_008596 [Morchella sextelata]